MFFQSFSDHNLQAKNLKNVKPIGPNSIFQGWLLSRIFLLLLKTCSLSKLNHEITENNQWFVKRVLESNKLVVGGGCVEVSTSLYLENFARSLGSREQMAINEYAESLNVIPKQLAINAAKDATDLLTKMRYVHERYQKEKERNEDTKKLKNTGLDLLNGKIRNNYRAGVFEPAISKVKSLKFATEAAITILRIDDLIRIEPEKNKQGKQ